MANSNSASQEIILGLGGPEEDHPLHHVGEREEDVSVKLISFVEQFILNQPVRLSRCPVRANLSLIDEPIQIKLYTVVIYFKGVNY